MEQMLSPPPEWGNDFLTQFIETAYRNRFATFANKKNWVQRLIRIDDCFMRLAKDWLNPSATLIAPLLFFRSHAAFRAACEHALAGQVTETFPQTRSCIEFAGYALHIYKNADLEEMWLRRHDDLASLKAAKSAFKYASVLDTIEKANRHVANIFNELYQRAIDFGAHPNERSITGSLRITNFDDRKKLEQLYLHGDGLALDHALKTTAQTGVCALEVFSEVFAPRFELLGVRAELLELRKGL